MLTDLPVDVIMFMRLNPPFALSCAAGGNILRN